VQDFDYIIIGAGSAGCVLADRLSADPRNRVLVLEAGGTDQRFWVKVPLGYAFAYTDPRISVQCPVEPDPELMGRRNSWPRGRVVGGCSSINAMAYMRGLPRDFDDWESAGARGWGWSTIRQVYDTLEAQGDTPASGPIRVNDLSRDMHPFSQVFLDAAAEAGWPVLHDLNTGQAGLGRYRSTVWKGRRWSAVDAFLRPALRRKNIRLETQAIVQHIELDQGQARAVVYRQHGQIIRAGARCEVILSAGAVHSPQILQLSGIGPGAVLQAQGLGVQNDLAEVGRGLQDHLAITYSFWANPKTLNAVLGTPHGRVLSGLRYLATRRGPLSVPVNQVGGYIPSHEQGIPDTQIYCNPMVYTYGQNGPTVMRESGYILSAQPCRPTSRGEIKITSARAEDQPSIQPNSLATEEDRASVIRAGRLLQHLAQSDTLVQARRAALGPDLSALDDAALLDDFRARASTVFHPSCTCRIGDDPAASVLDARLRVHGTGRLRVVDASAFPNITSGNTNAPTMMLAARAATLILEDNK
jgi:choline dehydrogenase